MAHQSDLIASDIDAYLKQQEEKSLLRFITCGSVDDGKSTLIGRLLWDSKMIFEDQLAALESDSRKIGTQGGAIDYALLLDGLQAEREQGITIDVAYRFFSTDKRKFIVADTPGHEQYTRNMVTGASTAQVAVILVDARKGILTQTRRHSYLVSLVGIKHIVLAVNKMDLIDFAEDNFQTIKNDYLNFSAPLGFDSTTAIPLSALNGDNMIEASKNTPWYTGSTLMNFLETFSVEGDNRNQPFRMPVQWVNRPNLDFRGFCGTIAAGTIRQGDYLRVAASGKTSKVAKIIAMNGDLPEAVSGQAVTITLSDEIDISRGDILTAPDSPPAFSCNLETHLVWMHDEALLLNNTYLIKTASTLTQGRITRIEHLIDVNSLEHKQADTLELNEIGFVQLELDRPIAFDPYEQNRHTGSFIIIDRFSNATVAAGMISHELNMDGQDNNPESQKYESDPVSIRKIFRLDERLVNAEALTSSIDLGNETADIEFVVAESFLNYLQKGKRVIFHLYNLKQLNAVATFIYEHKLSLEFKPYKNGGDATVFM